MMGNIHHLGYLPHTGAKLNKQDFLLEIGCDELPARYLKRLVNDLCAAIVQELGTAKLHFESTRTFATPRRIAVIVTQLDTKQPKRSIERHGPFVKDAYDKDGTPTLACIGFARSCGVSIDQLQQQDTPKGKRVCVSTTQPGLDTSETLADITETAIKKIPLPKTMRWGNSDITFLRQVQWVLMLFGRIPIEATILGTKTTTNTFGHRFHHPQPIQIHEPSAYETLLESTGQVIADFDRRRKIIKQQLQTAAAPNHVFIDETLLDEVTGLVEWPVSLKGQYSADFLNLPSEVLITSMKTHQKCFPVVDDQGNLQPAFLLVSNIDSKDPATVIKGNERVIHARLADAAFFYQNDCKVKLEDRLKTLDKMIFQKKLGSLGEKVKRINKLAVAVSKLLEADTDITKQGAILAKCDLVTEMVFEFPNLQGLMGYYYALHDKTPKAIATIIKEHYLPKFSGDALPSSKEAAAVALADRLDTLVGIIGINQKPTGDKDPFALRRATHGVLRILIEKQFDIDLSKLIHLAAKNLGEHITNKNAEADVLQFILERLKYWYIEQNIPVEIYESVAATKTTNLLDFDQRIQAVMAFRQLPEAAALAAANKRVSNILKKQSHLDIPKKINAKYLEDPAEAQLAEMLKSQQATVTDLYIQKNYKKALSSLACLKDPIDQFFDDVMVMDKDENKRNNRLALLATLRKLFSQTADISLLS